VEGQTAGIDEDAWRTARRVALVLLATWTAAAIAVAIRAGVWTLLLTTPLGLAIALGAFWLSERAPRRHAPARRDEEQPRRAA
jgi:predicted phage tail protein